MGQMAEEQAANILPPRRGEVLALAVDATARGYALGSLALGGATPEGAATGRQEIYVTVQAVTADVWLYFAPATASDLDPATAVAAGGTLSFANTYGWRVPSGTEQAFRLNRAQDKFLVCRTSSGTATLLIRASSPSTL
jgi:hypothetical protein